MLGKEMPREVPREKAPNPLWNHYLCGDGRWLALAYIQPDRNWPDLCRALGIEQLRDDPRFSDQNARGENCAELIQILDKIFAQRPRDEWMKILRETSKDLIFTPLNTITDVTQDPQALANEYIIEFDHPVFGTTKMLGIPIRLSETPGSIRREAPEFGQHTEEVLIDILGMNWEEIGRLKDEEVI
jgi:crotonobetainyl-CoA:carnitine CoA-transferase CaiB-like acyl-CoA transferase